MSVSLVGLYDTGIISCLLVVDHGHEQLELYRCDITCFHRLTQSK